MIRKVTVFICRNNQNDYELLLFEHPHAGIQIPGGTLEAGENEEQAARREALEETGLSDLQLRACAGHVDSFLTDGKGYIIEPTELYSRPDQTSFNWAKLRAGLTVEKLRDYGDYSQVKYTEYDSFPDQNFVTYQLMGWIPKRCFSNQCRRYFFHFETSEKSNSWKRQADNHEFRLFWASLSNLPEIVWPQNEWIDIVKSKLGYQFRTESPGA